MADAPKKLYAADQLPIVPLAEFTALQGKWAGDLTNYIRRLGDWIARLENAINVISHSGETAIVHNDNINVNKNGKTFMVCHKVAGAYTTIGDFTENMGAVVRIDTDGQGHILQAWFRPDTAGGLTTGDAKVMYVNVI